MQQIILASQSPSRKEILTRTGLKFSVVVSHFDERLNPRLSAKGQAEALSLGKAEVVAAKHPDAIIIAADSFVVFQQEIIGKPQDEKHAKQILRKLRGNTHMVITGLTVMDLHKRKSITKSFETKVIMKKLSEKEINAYVKKAKVLDKAAGYNINELGGIFVEKIEGDYTNVMGLPLAELVEILKKFDIHVFS